MTRLPSSAERRAAGEQVRSKVPLGEHAIWKAEADRPDPVALLESQASTRIPSLVPVRYGRMAVSPFTFLRGAALPMAADLATTKSSGITVQLCGDAHLSNFGLFASPERDLVFDINDFDETIRGPFEFDVKRLAASLVVAGRSRGFNTHQNAHTVHAAVRTYRERMAEYASMRAIDIFYARVDAASILAYVDKRARPFLQSTVKSASHHDALHELPKLTEVGPDGERRIVDHPPVIRHVDVEIPFQQAALESYIDTLQEDRRLLVERYRLVDAALKVVGVGSVGLGAYACLLDGGGGEDPLFLQVKQAEASVYERFLGPSEYSDHGQRVVIGQRCLQAVSDILLGWTTGPHGRNLYVRQLQDQKGGAVVEAMTADDLESWGELCGWALARGHARSGDPAMIAGYLGTDSEFDHAIGDFAAAYADQTERDHAAFQAAIASGRIVAQSGV
ncbi:MAG: DUF2252 domain-containing protein [Candidatus Limnocylindrales bacterium]